MDFRGIFELIMAMENLGGNYGCGWVFTLSKDFYLWVNDSFTV